MTDPTITARLEYLRGEIDAERISMSEIAELQGLAEHIDPSDVDLLEWAGAPEFGTARYGAAIRALASRAYDAMERAERDDGTEYTRRRDDAPEWVADIIREAHGDMFPDDWRYSTIREAFGAIADSPNDELDDSSEFADGADVYNADLISWVGSHGSRAGYVDDAREEFGEPRDFYHSLQMGQYQERAEVYAAVLEGLRLAVTEGMTE